MKKAKPTTWRPNSTLKPPSKPIARSVAPKKQNAARIKKRRDAEHGPHSDWVVASFPCFVCERWEIVQQTPTVPAHASKTRGAGGKAKHLVDLCATHENIWHWLGNKTFDRCFGVDCKARAEYLWSISPFNPDNVSGEQ